MNIKFYQPYKIPLVLALDVDGTRVYYEHKKGGPFEFIVEFATEEKAMEIVKEVIQVIKSEQQGVRNDKRKPSSDGSVTGNFLCRT